MSAQQKSFNLLKSYNFFSYGSLAVLMVYFPLYFAELGLSKLEVGMIMSSGPFISILANPIWGYISDKTQNTRRTITILLAGCLIMIQLAVRMETFGAILLAMLTFFFFQSPTNAQGSSLILNAIEGTKRKFGEFRLWGSLGYAFTAIAVGPLIDQTGVGKLWLIYTAILLTAILFTFGMPRGEVQQSATITDHGFGTVVRQPVFVAFILIGILISVPNAANNTFVSLYIQELGGTAVAAGWASFTSAFFEVPVFLLLDRFVRKEMRFLLTGLIVVSALYAARWFLMSLAATPFHVMLIQAMHCITYGGYYYLGTMLTALMIPPQYRASGQAAFTLTWAGISGIAAGVVGGMLYDSFGAATMYRINGLIASFSIIGFVGLRIRAFKSLRAGGED